MAELRQKKRPTGLVCSRCFGDFDEDNCLGETQCYACGGTGIEPDNCPECGGTGIHHVYLGHGDFAEDHCSFCDGTGDNPNGSRAQATA